MSATRKSAAAALAGALLLAACTAAAPTRFYTLSSLLAAPGEPAFEVPPDLSVSVGPVTLPEYLNRPQLVTRDGSNRVIIADFDNWIEPLDGMVARTLAENLSLLLGTDEVLAMPQRRPFQPNVQVGVDITRFDADTSGNAVLDARWWLLGARGDRVLVSNRSTLVEQGAAGDRATGAQALSVALGRLSREIAAAIADEADG
jgi:uncharacterized lipoprotein YmbA